MGYLLRAVGRAHCHTFRIRPSPELDRGDGTPQGPPRIAVRIACGAPAAGSPSVTAGPPVTNRSGRHRIGHRYTRRRCRKAPTLAPRLVPDRTRPAAPSTRGGRGFRCRRRRIGTRACTRPHRGRAQRCRPTRTALRITGATKVRSDVRLPYCIAETWNSPPAGLVITDPVNAPTHRCACPIISRNRRTPVDRRNPKGIRPPP